MSYTPYNNPSPSENYVSEISNGLLAVGIPPHLQGYPYLVDALNLISGNEGYLNGVTKNLYPTIAKKHQATPFSVERSIRSAIEAAWNKNQCGPLAVYLTRKSCKPTNREFLALSYKWIQLQQ